MYSFDVFIVQLVFGNMVRCFFPDNEVDTYKDQSPDGSERVNNKNIHL